MITEVLRDLQCVYLQFVYPPPGFILPSLHPFIHLSPSAPSHKPQSLLLCLINGVSVCPLSLHPGGKDHKLSTLPSLSILLFHLFLPSFSFSVAT